MKIESVGSSGIPTYKQKEITISISNESPWTFIIKDKNETGEELLKYLEDHRSSINILYGLKERNLDGRRSGHGIYIKGLK